MSNEALEAIKKAGGVVEGSDAPALSTNATTDVALLQEAASPNWGAVTEYETTDLLIPKIYHQQSTSAFAKSGAARPGDFCDSVTGEVLATKDNGLEVIVFGVYKTMLISKQTKPDSTQYELQQIVTVTHENAKDMALKPFTEKDSDGLWIKNSLVYNFFCLLPSRIKELPFVLSLGSTKTKVAKKIATIQSNLAQKGRNGASVVFKITNYVEKNEKGDWFGLDVAVVRNAEPMELMQAYAWHVKSKSQAFGVVEGTEQESDNIPF